MDQFELNENSFSRKKVDKLNPIYIEPEIEACCEESQLRKISEAIGVDYYSILNIKSIDHDDNDPDCMHCRISNKIEELHKGIFKMSKELRLTEEILKLKRNQNADIRNIIENIETSIPQTLKNSEIIFEDSVKTCSCSRSCVVF